MASGSVSGSKTALKLARVPSARGGQWVAFGWKVFGRKPLAFTGLFAFFLFVAFAVLLVPGIGPPLMLSLLPLLSLGFMIATREALAGRFPAPAVFFAPITGDATRRARLIGLGLLYAAGGVLIMLASDAIDGGRFDELQALLGSERDEDRQRVAELLDDPRLQLGTLTRLALTAALAVPFWHAPALIHWAGHGVAQSLFSSTVAVWHNRGAFIVYVLAWSALVLGFSVAIGAIAAVTGARTLMAVLALPAGLTFSTVFYASLYFSYADSFSEADGASTPPAS